MAPVIEVERIPLEANVDGVLRVGGTREYELIDVLPAEQITRAPIGYILAQ
jgi:hypothetical protein